MRYEATHRMRSVVGLGLALVVLFASAGWADLIQNGDFTGGLTGWTHYKPDGGSGSVAAVAEFRAGGTSWTGDGLFALLIPDGADKRTWFGQSFSLSSQQNVSVSFDYFWDMGDATDTGAARIFAGSGKLSGSPLYSISLDHDTDTIDWISQTWSVGSLNAGIYTLVFEIVNVGSGESDSHLGLDNVSVVPVPAAVLLAFLGLGVAGWKLRQSL